MGTESTFQSCQLCLESQTDDKRFDTVFVENVGLLQSNSGDRRSFTCVDRRDHAAGDLWRAPVLSVQLPESR